ncbi:1-acylglycerol-3-phosphate O-acyltransferase PNPLA3 [Eulemur rufifrons]|uniref:1-acylglycerol-3-phosphate O-acyltransferase PNPLA3 n=1 Tax=Eulemur rufifrons TaxID=859984 RepID=UPI003742F270
MKDPKVTFSPTSGGKGTEKEALSLQDIHSLQGLGKSLPSRGSQLAPSACAPLSAPPSPGPVREGPASPSPQGAPAGPLCGEGGASCRQAGNVLAGSGRAESPSGCGAERLRPRAAPTPDPDLRAVPHPPRAAAMYDLQRGWSLSFSGCGFLGFYHVGATHCLSERAPHLLRNVRMFFGASSGALHCVAYTAGISLDRVLQILMDIARMARRKNIGVFHPSFNISKQIRDNLCKYLPADAHKRISGKVCISLTRVSDGKNVLVSDFHSKDEVVDALLCSTFIPFYCGFIPPTFRGVRYVDGGGSDNVPLLDAKTTITVCPFYGEYDICPKTRSTNFLHVYFNTFSMRVCSANLYLLLRMLSPPDPKVLGELCLRGYLDALRFLEENGICDRPQLCLELSPDDKESEVTGPQWENMSLESSPGPAAMETGLQGHELLDHLDLSILPWDKSILPWDESILGTLSPTLTKALNKALKDRGGYMSKIGNFLPVKIMSYVMLPCTLPLESAFIFAQRLVTWLPDIPEDVQWLQWATSKICARVMTCLLPTSRSQMPASGPQASPCKPDTAGTVGLPASLWS